MIDLIKLLKLANEFEEAAKTSRTPFGLPGVRPDPVKVNLETAAPAETKRRKPLNEFESRTEVLLERLNEMRAGVEIALRQARTRNPYEMFSSKPWNLRNIASLISLKSELILNEVETLLELKDMANEPAELGPLSFVGPDATEIESEDLEFIENMHPQTQKS